MRFPKASFCISTYKRPELLQKQLELIATQSFKNFEVIISDNDPEKSAQAVVLQMHDPRFKYFCNETNLGMIKSFNKSIERAEGEYVVMITDDDPVAPNMLEELLQIAATYPSFPIYCGCVRNDKKESIIETYDRENFVFQILDPTLTPSFLWSSCLLKRDVVLRVGGVPDYGSPHLADHALLALCSKFDGGVFINKMYGMWIAHEKNFSKSNFELYYLGCNKFYQLIIANFKESAYKKNGINALKQHLVNWFISNSFNLRNFFTYQNRNKAAVKDVVKYSKQILGLPFMKGVYPRYLFKLIIFYLKYPYNNWVYRAKRRKEINLN